MVDWLGVKDIVSFFADSNAILGALALVSGSFAGVIPRVGLVRALSLGYRSYFKTTYPLSVRESEIKQLNDLILRLEKKLHYCYWWERKWENLPDQHNFESPPWCSKNQCKLSFLFY